MRTIHQTHRDFLEVEPFLAKQHEGPQAKYMMFLSFVLGKERGSIHDE